MIDGRGAALELAGLAAGGAIFGVAWERALRGDIHLSEAELNTMVNNLHDAARWPLAAVMQLGSLGGGLAVTALAWPWDRRTTLTTAAAVALAYAGAKAVKASTRRGRPFDHLTDVIIRGKAATGFGFPSGHAAVSAAAAIGLAGVVPPGAGLALAAGAVATSVARVYVGAHLPLDVIGGAGMGAALGCLGRLARRALS